MQAEVDFGDVIWLGGDARGHMDSVDVLQGVLMVWLAAFILATLVPRLLRPFLRAVGDEAAVDALCVPSEHERLTLSLIGIATIGASLWTLSALAPTGGAIWKIASVGEPLVGILYVTALVSGLVMLVGLSQRTADRLLGSGFAALIGLAATLSSVVVFARGESPAWLFLWFPLCLLLGQMTRSVQGAPWKITGGVAALLGTVIVLRSLGLDFNTLV